jgi:hypothetical protein
MQYCSLESFPRSRSRSSLFFHISLCYICQALLCGAALRHNGGFYNTCTLKRCLHRKVDFKTNTTYNDYVSQLFPFRGRIVTKGLYYFVLSDQNKLVEIGCLLNCSPFWTDSLWEQSHLKAQLFGLYPSSDDDVKLHVLLSNTLEYDALFQSAGLAGSTVLYQHLMCYCQ